MDPTPLPDVSLREIARAARVLRVRSRREATNLLAGGYTSAFRGGGIEFEESRPYAPGDDVRFLDWNATARTGEPWVKRFREERSQTVLIAMDASASMRFGSAGRSKAARAAHAVALLAAAAGRAGDRIGLLAFADAPVAEVRPGRGEAHTWRVIRAAVAAAAASGGGTRLAPVLEWARVRARRHAVFVLISDLRDESVTGTEPAAQRLRARLAALARRHDVVAVVPEDPRERALPPAGVVRLADPERPRRRLVLATGRAARERYAAAALERHRALDRLLRSHGVEPLWMSTRSEPLHALTHFFRERAALTPRRAR